MERTDFVTESARQFALIANSPLFLINRLKSDSGVHAIVARFRFEQIFDTLRHLSTNPSVSSDSAVDFYVWLVAFAIVATPAQWSRLAEIPIPHLRWIQEIIAVLSAEKRDSYSVTLPERNKIRRVTTASERFWGGASPISPNRNLIKGKA